MHLFAVGGDDQLYEQDFDANGHSTGDYYLTRQGLVKDFVLAQNGPSGAYRLGAFAVGADDQVYEQAFDAAGHSAGAYALTAPGQVKQIAAGTSYSSP
jgi:hypothetical protein